MATGLDDDEWEYEYDSGEREIFLVDLDLSSLNQPLRSNVPGKRPLDRPPESSTPFTPPPPPPLTTDNNDADPFIEQTPTQRPQETIQILSLPTLNPIISHRSNIYSATWTDMVGTNMFFSIPSHSSNHSSQPVQPFTTPIHHDHQSSSATTATKHHPQLIGTSRIRLQCHRAHTTRITNGPGSLPSSSNNNNGKGHGGGKPPRVKSARDAKERQAEFLDRLRKVRAKKKRKIGMETKKKMAMAEEGREEPDAEKAEDDRDEEVASPPAPAPAPAASSLEENEDMTMNEP